MVRQPASSLMTALGFTPAVDWAYHRILPKSGRPLAEVAQVMLCTPEELLERVAPLLDHGIVRVADDGVLLVETPAEAVSTMVRQVQDDAARAQTTLDTVLAAVPFLDLPSGNLLHRQSASSSPVDGEIRFDSDAGEIVREILEDTSGDMLWFRPDSWFHPAQAALAPLLDAVVSGGRRSRAIYPFRAWREAPQVLRSRAAAGEEVRLVAELPTRLVVCGTSFAVMPEPLGFADAPRSVVRQRGLVEALILLFEQVWSRAVPLPVGDGDERSQQRRLLLEQLAAGVQDEQIARRLGISLRTVRRRVADLLGELGVETRFQAGVEAARRGWL